MPRPRTEARAIPGNDQDSRLQQDLEAYRTLLEMWSQENPIKTTKLQVLLAVNAILVSAISVSGGFGPENRFLYAAGAVFCLVWTFSIGRTALFQNAWKAKLEELRARHPGDPRFSILETADQRKRAPYFLRLMGGISSKWYLLLSPIVFASIWIAIFFVAGDG